MLTIAEAAAGTGWSPRMLRYIERAGLVVPERSEGGYRLYGPDQLRQLRTLTALRRRFAVGLTELAFARRLRDDADLRHAIDGWLGLEERSTEWLRFEQRKHELLLAA